MRWPDADERMALVGSTFLSGCLCLLPMEWIPASVLFGLSGLQYGIHRFIGEEEEAPAPAPGASPPSA